MIDKPLISVCLPCYNGGKYISQCIESILPQSYSNLEIVIIDDCSTDNTCDIIDQYKDERIRVIENNKNIGLVNNWNKCVHLSRGDWVKFVFQDDIIEKNCIAKLFKVASEGFDLVACNRNFIFDSSVSQEIKNNYLSNKKIIESIFNKSNILIGDDFCNAILRYPYCNLLGEPTVTLINKRLFSKYGFFNANLIQDCDSEFWVRVGIHAGVAFIPEELASFRVHSNSATARNSNLYSFRKNLDKLLIFYEYRSNPLYDKLRNYDDNNSLLKKYTLESHMAHYLALKAYINILNRNSSYLHDLKILIFQFPGLRINNYKFILWLCSFLAERVASKFKMILKAVTKSR